MSSGIESRSGHEFLSHRFAVTILFSSFLLFQIQPMIARAILPWFGGGAMVWCACMLFFQVVLLGGYFLAHLIFSRLEPALQGVFFILLLALTVATLDITPHRSLGLRGGQDPLWSIIVLLLRHVGLPYLTLAAVSPLIQGWFGLTYAGRSPYRLYAISNFGSLAALLSYPFLIEPNLGLAAQARMWSALYLVFAVCMGACAAMLMFGRVAAPVPEKEGGERPPSLPLAAVWVGIAATSSLLLLAITNRLTHEVSVTPVLWVLPLSLYLLSFILCFDSDRWYKRSIYMPLVFFFAIFSGVNSFDSAGNILFEASGAAGLLFSGCMVCHGELVRLKPGPRHLTAFYLFISLGGALGGLFVALIAPMIFDSYFEMPLSVALIVLLMMVTIWISWREHPDDDGLRQAWGGAIGAGVVVLLLLAVQVYNSNVKYIAMSRNFYGVLRMFEEGAGDPGAHRIVLSHGRTMHGARLVAEGERSRPISYYSPDSGIGLLFRHFKTDQPRRIGVLGLGTGTLAALADDDDYVRFYEIDPDVVEIARTRFHFLNDSRAKIDVVLGDARLSLEEEEPQAFDILVLDTFSGDAVPVHLMTVEAMALYLKHLKPDGVLVVHISSRYYNLAPLLKALQIRFGLEGGLINHFVSGQGGYLSTKYYLLTRNEEVLFEPAIIEVLESSAETMGLPLPREMIWTDDYSNVMMLLHEADRLR